MKTLVEQETEHLFFDNEHFVLLHIKKSQITEKVAKSNLETSKLLPSWAALNSIIIVLIPSRSLFVQSLEFYNKATIGSLLSRLLESERKESKGVRTLMRP